MEDTSCLKDCASCPRGMEIMTPLEVSRYLKVSKSKVYSYIQAGRIPFVRFDRNVRIKKSDLMLWIEKHTVNQPKMF